MTSGTELVASREHRLDHPRDLGRSASGAAPVCWVLHLLVCRQPIRDIR